MADPIELDSTVPAAGAIRGQQPTLHCDLPRSDVDVSRIDPVKALAIKQRDPALCIGLGQGRDNPSGDSIIRPHCRIRPGGGRDRARRPVGFADHQQPNDRRSKTDNQRSQADNLSYRQSSPGGRRLRDHGGGRQRQQSLAGGTRDRLAGEFRRDFQWLGTVRAIDFHGVN
jgi:hypothetical protein